MMKIKDMPHVTVEQVLDLRSAAIDREKQRDELLAALEHCEDLMRSGGTWTLESQMEIRRLIRKARGG